MILQIGQHLTVHTLRAKKIIADTLYTQVVNPIDFQKIFFDWIGIFANIFTVSLIIFLWANKERWGRSENDEKLTAACVFLLLLTLSLSITWWIN